MKIPKPFVIIALLIITAVLAFGMPKPKYKSTSILSTLNIPSNVKTWQGQDVSSMFDPKNDAYKFIGNIFATTYKNEFSESLLLLVLDAGNFHNPKVCMGASGYTSKELPDTEFKTSYNKFKAHNVYFEKGKESVLIIYWICIDKKVVDWNRQKLIQLWYSLFNKSKAGLMVRIDIPADKNNIPRSIKTAGEFIADLSNSLPRDKAEYLFGN